MAWLFLPENEQVQYLQKIALRAENRSRPKQFNPVRLILSRNYWTSKYFLRQQFSAAIEAAHFPAAETGH
jgi:hypothetical protein